MTCETDSYVGRFCSARFWPPRPRPKRGNTNFQSDPSSDRDTLWNGILIGAGVGAAVGMLIAPQALCGAHDTECSTIVRVAIGLPAIAGGVGIGALVDGLNWKF